MELFPSCRRVWVLLARAYSDTRQYRLALTAVNLMPSLGPDPDPVREMLVVLPPPPENFLEPRTKVRAGRPS